MFDMRATFSYTSASSSDATPVNGLTGDGVWNRDGYHNEGVTFDPALAHQDNTISGKLKPTAADPAGKAGS
ncbi:MAG: hypothetical protein V4726_15440 [Verrucomicrobiota bacterium]